MTMLLVSPVRALADAMPPYEMERHRTLLSALQERRRPGDLVLAFPLSRVGLMYYGPAYGLERRAWRTIACDRNETRAYVTDVDRHRGAPRVWLVSTDARPFRAARAAVRGYLSTIGARRDSVSFPSPSLGDVSLELYDLSDPARLSRADPTSFPVPPIDTDPRPSCRDWVMDSYETSPR